MERVELILFKQAALLKTALLSSSLEANLKDNAFILACNLNRGHFASPLYYCCETRHVAVRV